MVAFLKKYLRLQLERKTLVKIQLLRIYYNDETIINTKTHFYTEKSFLNYFELKIILLNILQNFAIYLFKFIFIYFCFANYNFSK